MKKRIGRSIKEGFLFAAYNSKLAPVIFSAASTYYALYEGYFSFFAYNYTRLGIESVVGQHSGVWPVAKSVCGFLAKC